MVQSEIAIWRIYISDFSLNIAVKRLPCLLIYKYIKYNYWEHDIQCSYSWPSNVFHAKWIRGYCDQNKFYIILPIAMWH